MKLDSAPRECPTTPHAARKQLRNQTWHGAAINPFGRKFYESSTPLQDCSTVLLYYEYVRRTRSLALNQSYLGLMSSCPDVAILMLPTSIPDTYGVRYFVGLF
jgi:hypothetical protein